MFYFCREINCIVMKKLASIFKIAALAFVIVMTSCTKKDSGSTNGSGGGGTVIGNHLTRITDICNYYNENNVQFSTSVTEDRFRYTGDLVTEWSSYYNGELDAIAYLSYDNGRLIKADITYTIKKDMTIYFNYTGQYITSADMYSGSEHVVCTFEYENGNMISAISPYITYNLNWIDDDVTRLNVVDEGSDIMVYDTKLNPMNKQAAFIKALFDEEFEYLSKHDVKHKQWISDYGGGQSTDYSYTYDASNTYPVSRTYTITYSNYHASGETEYEYED